MWNIEQISNSYCRDLKKLSFEEIDEIANIVVSHYRKTGYPFLQVDKLHIEKEFRQLKKYDTSLIELEDNEIQQSMVGLTSCNMFHPHMPSVKCHKANSPMEIFLDDALLKKAIIKRILIDNRKLNDKCIRRTLTAFGGQSVSNFKPTVAKWAYMKFAIGGKILDPSMGYGGRLMGALASEIVSYDGVDPEIKTIHGNINLYNAISEIANEKLPVATFYQIPFEDFITDETYDMVFTSPPYFDIEKYSDDEKQSYKRYPTYELWIEKFLFKLIQKSYDFLNNGGIFGLNVANPIDKDTYEIGCKVFGSSPLVYNMRLSKFVGNKKYGSGTHKLEPIFIWKK